MNREALGRLNTVLNRFTDSNVKVRQDRKTEALNSWQPIVEKIVDYVKERDNYGRFARLRIFPTGSYYERSKVGEPDEFDLMLVVDNLELDGDPYGEEENDGMSEPPPGFTRVMIDRGEEVLWQRESCANAQGMLNASQVKSVFASLVRDAIRDLRFESGPIVEDLTKAATSPRNVSVNSQGPAVTLKITNMNGREYSVDLTLAIRDKSWPEDAEEWRTRPRNGWPSPQLVQEIWRDGCHLVAKQPKGGNIPDHEKGFLWRFSFSAAEKKLFLRGSHGEESSCRKKVLRILKALKEELNLHPLKSYHLKTMLLYEYEVNPRPSQWSFDRLSERFMGLLQRLESCLQQANCPHYFIKHLNLFETISHQRCSELARMVQQIRLRPEEVLNSLIGQAN